MKTLIQNFKIGRGGYPMGKEESSGLCSIGISGFLVGQYEGQDHNSFMTAYNALNNVPCTLNSWLLQKVLRRDWGFQGYVVSDCGGPSL